MRGEITSILMGTMTQEKRLEVLSNNMANAKTVGFKEDQIFRIPPLPPSFWENSAPPDNWPRDNMVMLPIGTFTNFDQGPLKETGNSLDLALGGDGFFCVQTPRGIQYTRKGDFILNSDGTLVTQQGYPVLNNGNNEIKIDGRQVIVDSKGGLVVDGAESDRLKIVQFENKKGLLKSGDSLYSPMDPADQGTPADNVIIQQGFIEESNVDSIKIMTDLIDVVRGYESYQKILQSINETNSKTVNELGKLS